MHNIRKKKLKTKDKTKLLLYTLITLSLYAILMHLLEALNGVMAFTANG